MNPIETYIDPFGIISSFQKICESWMQHPIELSQNLAELNLNIQEITIQGLQEIAETLSKDTSAKQQKDIAKDIVIDVVKSSSKLARKYYLVYSNWLRNFTENAPDVNGNEKARSVFWTNQMLNALAPSNYFWTNPTAVQKFIRSEGESLKKGYENLLEDIARGDNMLAIADDKAFKIGENIASAPGHVVFRNELIELIQYTPTTETVYALPVVFIQPWINKFYIFDLSGQTSFVRYLVNQGFTVFITSWKNPDKNMRHITFEDYMVKGALKAAETAKEICGGNPVHVAGYCIGGTILTALMAWLNRGEKKECKVSLQKDFPIADWTLFSTLTDFSNPGELGVFISESAIASIEMLMKQDGYLDGKYMGMVFRLLRSESLIWRYVVNNYLQGNPPPKSDMLYWNSDSTRLPEAMCSFYLRELYLKNKLIQKDGLTLANRPIDLRRIEQPLYAVGAEQDHISPWKETFRICNLVSSPIRYVLTSEGHIAGIVNPPSPISKKKYRAGEARNDAAPDIWLSAQEEQKGSWWEDWMKWLTERSKSKITPPAMGSETYPPMEKAPGSYVLE